MKLEDTRNTFYEYSAKASDLSRQLALAALAVVWIFKSDQPSGKVSVPAELFWPAALAVATLAADLFQYVYATIAWQRFDRYKEKEFNLDETAEFDAPQWINWPTHFFFYSKLVLIVASYVMLLAYLFKTILH